jgi:hypothetical protein
MANGINPENKNSELGVLLDAQRTREQSPEDAKTQEMIQRRDDLFIASHPDSPRVSLTLSFTSISPIEEALHIIESEFQKGTLEEVSTIEQQVKILKENMSQLADRGLFYSQMQRIFEELSEDKKGVFTEFLINNFKKELIRYYGLYYKVPFVQKALNAILDREEGELFFETIQEYDIKEQGTLTEIFKLTAGKDGYRTSEFIQENPAIIEDQEVLFEIAKIAAKDPCCPMTRFISGYRIQDSKRHAIIAMIAAEKDPAGTSEFIGEYHIEDEKDRIEVAKIAARENGWFTSMFIENYQISDSEELFEIAKIAAKQNGGKTSMFIFCYGIEDEGKRIQIAKIAAANDPEGTCEYIHNFAIKDQAALIEIAKMIASKNDRIISQFIHKFDIKDQAARIEIAKIAAKQDGGTASEWIRNYNIMDPVALIEIAKIAIAQNHGASFSIQNYGITNPKALITIFLIAFIQSPTEAASYIRCYQFPDTYAYFVQAIGEFGQYHFNSEECMRYLQCFADQQNWSDQVRKLILQITQSEDPEEQESRLCWLTHFLGSCSTLTVKQSSFLLGTNLPRKILNYYDSNLSYTLTEAILTYAENPDVLGPISGKKENEISRDESLLLLCYFLNGKGISKDLCQQLISVGKSESFKDKTRLKAYLGDLYLIGKNTQLEASNKIFLFQNIITLSKRTVEQSVKGNSKRQTVQKIDAKILLRHLRVVSTILFLKGEDLLRALEGEMKQQESKKENFLEKTTLSDSKDIFSPILLELFRNLIPINSFENFDELYVKHFANARIPNYIIIYAARLQSLSPEDKQPVLAALSTCIEKMFNETLPEERYNEHVHLQTVFSGREKLLEQWKRGEKIDLINFLSLSNSSGQQQIDFLNILKQKILVDKHLGTDKGQVGHLMGFLEGSCTAEEALERIEQEKKLTENPVSPDTQALCIQLDIQALCIQLALSQESLKTQEILKSLQAQLRRVPYADAFKNDVTSFSQKPSTIKYDKWTLVDTDDPQDLFLCGTEVGGSCQRIDDNLSLNKCLLAYVMDGKIRVLAVKDASGRIVARHVLRILWDGNQPVLFLSRLYPSIVKKEIQDALEAFALSRAQQLGLPLLSKEVGGKGSIIYPHPIIYPYTVESLGSKAPFEYLDGYHDNEGIAGVTKGTYEISDCMHLNST